MRVFLCGDTHGDFRGVKRFCETMQTTKEDVVIILGDAGCNYFLNERDDECKEIISKLSITLFLVRGNHESRPDWIEDMHYNIFFDGDVWEQLQYPNIKYAIDGMEYNILGNKVLVVGGAYSPDKDRRILRGWSWFSDEQLNENERNMIIRTNKGKEFDYVLTHTGPKKYEPVELFFPETNQLLVDKSMENFLDELENNISYKNWVFGHYHGNKIVNEKVRILFNGFEELEDKNV